MALKVLVAYGFDAASDRALEWASRFAHDAGAEVDVVHVLQPHH